MHSYKKGQKQLDTQWMHFHQLSKQVLLWMGFRTKSPSAHLPPQHLGISLNFAPFGLRRVGLSLRRVSLAAFARTNLNGKREDFGKEKVKHKGGTLF